jgi:hypothetical protein
VASLRCEKARWEKSYVALNTIRGFGLAGELSGPQSKSQVGGRSATGLIIDDQNGMSSFLPLAMREFLEFLAP